MDRLNKDFYVVFMHNGKKHIYVWGYCWKCDSPQRPFMPYRKEVYRECYLNPGFTEEEYKDAISNCDQRTWETTEEDIILTMNEYFGRGEEYESLPMRSVTQDTPCGCYIDR